MAELFRYAAFISYSSKDSRFAQRLHRALETYGIPASLGAFDLIGGGKKNRIYPVFRDREELSAGDLGERIESSLKASAALIAVCSPNSAASPWVQKEIEFFAGLGRREKIFAIISDAAPLVDESGADTTTACFPPAFRTDALADATALEPLAADARKGKDGFRNAWLKLVAGLIGVTPGQLIDRDKKRRRQQRIAIGAGVSVVAFALAFAGAVRDASDRRSDLTGHANDITSQGRPLDAVAFALAGLPARGDVITSAHANADQAVIGTGAALRIVAEFGRLWAYRFSDDSRFLLTQDREGDAALLDLNDPTAAARPLGPIDQLIGFFFLGDGRFLLTQNGDDDWTLRDLHDPVAAPQPLGRLGSPYFLFSGDGRFLVTQDPEGAATLRDPSDPAAAPRPLGRLGLAGFLFSDDGRFLVTQDPEGAATLRDLNNPTAALRPLGRLAHRFRTNLSPFSFSGDGRFLITQDREGDAALRDLDDPTATPRPLGRLRELDSFSFSKDGRFLVIANPEGAATLRDPGDPAAALRPLGRLAPFRVFSFSGDGRFLITQDREDIAALRDLNDPAAPPRSLGRLGGSHPFSFSDDSRFLVTVTQDPEAAATLHDLHESAVVPQPLGQVGGLSFSGDSRFLLTMDWHDGNAALRDLNDPAAPPRPLGLLAGEESYSFSDDGRFLVTRDQEATATLRDLHDPTAAPRPLGRLGRLVGVGSGNSPFSFSSDGRFLMTEAPEGDAALRDLNAPVPVTSGAVLRAHICEASGTAIRPFPRALRLGEEAATTNLYRRLEGRPWNPCDWRGLLAIFPTERGDGWFEGVRQWWRLTHVRYFGGQDWSCEETISRAAEATRARRREMCERFAVTEGDDASENGEGE